MIIYKTTCLINGKIYIGQTTKDYEFYFGSGTKILSAIQKYGKENFKRETLIECKNQKHLDLFEAYFIKKFNSTDKEIGYNILSGTANEFGSGSPMKIKEIAEKVGNTNRKRFKENPKLRKQQSVKTKIRYRTKEGEKTREKLRKIGKTLKGEKNPNYGNKWNDEKKKELSEKFLGRYVGEKNPNYGNKWDESQRKNLSKKVTERNRKFGNPMNGKLRITNGEINTVIYKDQRLPEGFWYGMKQRKK